MGEMSRRVDEREAGGLVVFFLRFRVLILYFSSLSLPRGEHLSAPFV